MLHFTNLLFILCLVLSRADALYFNFSSFDTNPDTIILDWDATFYGSTIYLTKNPSRGQINNSVGKALYHTAMQLWDVNGSTTRLADFTTFFSFKISNVTGYPGTGDGLAFLLVPEDADWVPDRVFGGGLLGLFESETAALNGTARNHVVAIEFDTNHNSWDPVAQNHIGIDIDSIKSVGYANVTTNGGFVDQGIASVSVSYISTTMDLCVSFTFAGSSKSFDVCHTIDLSTILPQRVKVGFTAASAWFVEVHQLYSWSFYSSIGGEDLGDFPPISSPPTEIVDGGTSNAGLIGGIVGGGVVILVLLALLICWCRRRSRRNAQGKAILPETPLVRTQIYVSEDQHAPPQTLLTEHRLGLKRFSYRELCKATNDFTEELKLGRGGCGDVYQGKLGSTNERVAIKKFRTTTGSDQQIREGEYVSEVNAISMLRHKNLVQLKGWCHEKGELLLIYEFMPNRSLDKHLYRENYSPHLTWPTRYNIAISLASALNYLQYEADQCVVHRDIKSSNVMLDQDFNAKLGDFGLARLTDHGKSFRTTTHAGTKGYLAPEVAIRYEKATKASDVYSFGVVALELATGKKAILGQNGGLLVDWVWEKHRKDTILDEAVDERVKNSADFNKDEARRLIMIGLKCCLPDPSQRPSIEQVKDWLRFKTNALDVPRVKPRFEDYSPVFDFSSGISYHTSAKDDEMPPSSTTSFYNNNPNLSRPSS